ncbi:DUF4344 domain-containing metallopeptidase [Maritimibacter sp. DP1N21-5]|uniref:DUF4344 domain-containing metallopeptidase n=1 Tax=Maritimibacter sp. DP1N21-5 TaxID=2836867 RepID=UPI001C48F521|nr:DUF4344 domain-containing metallopeptidase [Maritimibacter sp. DP1N21-5]MBV7410828.1 DUF4344 domain-containing metallopeptidase [Maritimibacter sp. DP1N21-5]
MRRALALALMLGPSALWAEGSKVDYTFSREMAARPVTGGESRVNSDPVLAYVEANVTETLYHELAHALIDVLDLPVYGPEEFAADMFAIVLMNRLHDGATVGDMARDVGQNYRIYAEHAGDHPDDLALWDVHGPDMQRYYNFACLMYGADIQGRETMLAEFDLPEERAETCEDEYRLAARSWGAVLDSLATDAPGQSVRIDWVLNEGDHLTDFVKGEVARLNAAMVLPEPVTVSVIPCGQSNAFYDPDPREILICTELGEELAALAE